LDIGCGYGAQLEVALNRHPFSKVVGWTPSVNQVREGKQALSGQDPAIWEINEGDYREETRVFDHVTSTGMISHVGPRGLVPYVQNVRKFIKRGGRYVHQALMTPYTDFPIDREVGIAFNKKYVWPGFHWFTLGDHVRALESNGFEVVRISNLSPHFAKTTSCWYERMMANRAIMEKNLSESTFRAWQVYLAGAASGFENHTMHDFRIYCTAL